MKKQLKKLALRKEVVLNLTELALSEVQGGNKPITRSACATECPPTLAGCPGGNTHVC